ncbi:MAG: hypothetical protein M0R32_08240 [Candidatus Cloacimonetes bacterium]|jgi:peptidyl-tRNA hydrolase|nr:hypothetical protein [Candidatus Cloacimonadota bacterium]
MANLRQSILIRTDLGFPTGLLTAQVAHLHFEPFRKKIYSLPEPGEAVFQSEELDWMPDPYLFIHEVKNIESLEHYIKKAKEAGVNVHQWRDTVYIKMSDTQTEAIPNVLVGVSLGPCDSDKIKTVIGDLPLLK